MSELPTNGTLYRLNELERRLAALEAGQPAVMAERIRNIGEGQAEMRKHFDQRMDAVESEQESLKKTLIGAAVTIALSAIGFALTVLQVFG